MSQKIHPAAKNIGARFRSARALAPDLNRKDFCERHDINRYTMQSWENGLHVSKGKNVEKFIDALAKEGIACSAEWLIDGIGEPARPFLLPATKENPAEAEEKSEHEDDFLLFFNYLSQHYAHLGKNLLWCSVADDAMAPKFRSGDRLIGYEISDSAELSTAQFCIIDLQNNRTIVRKIIASKEAYLAIACDERQPALSLSLNTRLFALIWHYMRQ
jgi:hypothetical protein